ncbi:ATP-binding protein [Desulfococcus sp.]|uniref:ATP-binding protein n=1 Tax=Desulfococcus sp. TaxID=2025834 RepID=UPI0035941D73
MLRPIRKGEYHVLPELAEHVFRQLPGALYTTFLLSALMVRVLWDLFPAGILLSWLTAVYAVSLLRLILYHWHRLRPDSRFTPELWLYLYSSGAVLAGVTWGMAPLLFYSGTSPQTNVFIAFVLGGLISGASSSMAPLKTTMRVFTALLCLPIATLFILHGDSLHLAMGLMLLIYGVAYLVISANTAQMIVDSLTLRHENLLEIEERKNAETQLRLIQKDLEKTVAERTVELRTANEELSREIDERLQAESRLRVSEERYRSLVESSSDWIWEVDRDGRYTYSSPSILAMLGYTQQEVLGRMFYDFMPLDDAERTKAIFNSSKSSGKSFERLVSSCLHKDGTERIMETNGEPVFDDSGTLAGYRGIDRDITLRVKHEDEKRKVEHLKSLGLLAGGIAHDFNNLLMAVFGNIELARMEIDAGSGAGRALANSLAAIEQARKLTGQLLTFSRGGSPILEATSVRDLIFDSCRFALSGTDVRCEYDIPDDLWMADIDPNQIWRVLNNILTNARESMPGGGTLWVKAENVTVDETYSPALAPGDFVKVSVRDQGVGVSKTDIPQVFDPYFSTKIRSSQKGTGIGLAVCHSIIEKHGGYITLESELGQGTTVTFFLQALGAEHPPTTRTGDEPEMGPAGHSISCSSI